MDGGARSFGQLRMTAQIPAPRERGPGLRPAARTPRATLIYSDRPLIADGVAELLGGHDEDLVVVASSLEQLPGAGGPTLGAAVIDLDAPDPEQVAAWAAARELSVVLLTDPSQGPIDLELSLLADAILVRDEVEPRSLRVAIAAAGLGLRVTTRTLALAPHVAVETEAVPEPLGEQARRALELLADGLRDAEIALELNLSESATRKLIQRAVRRAGARTRCQAVAAAVRGGTLS